MKITAELQTFAATNEKFYNGQVRDYMNHYMAKNSGKKLEYLEVDEDGNKITFEQKDKAINQSLIAEIVKRSGVAYAAEQPVEQWFNHPLVKHETFAVVSAIVDMIIPDILVDSIGLYTDIRNIGWGDSAKFDVESNDLFVVTKGGRAQRHSNSYKQFKGTKTIVPENHMLTVEVSMYRVLSGKESLAEFIMKAIRSMEMQMRYETYDAFATLTAALASTATTGLQVAGYSQSDLIRLCDQVTAWNGGNKAIIVGTPSALASVLPNDANYRYNLSDPYMKLGYVSEAFGYSTFALAQVANYTTEWALKIASDRLWILSPGSQKLLKLVFEGQTLSFVDSPDANANLAQRATLNKAWGIGTVTNAVAGIMTL